MSTFFVLPSRSALGERFAEFLETVLPGLDLQRPQWRELAEKVGANLPRQSDVYVIYREDVPDNAVLDAALVCDFGAEPGDEIVEVALGGRLATLTARRWRLGQDVRQAA